MMVVFQEYSKAVTDADEKVQLANHIHELVSHVDVTIPDTRQRTESLSSMVRPRLRTEHLTTG